MNGLGESRAEKEAVPPCLATWFQWTVDVDIHDSNHYPISLRFNFGVSGVLSFPPDGTQIKQIGLS